jgi:myo-inositol-1(or 4)-monophosphatase
LNSIPDSLQITERIAREAGSLLIEYYRRGVKVEYKGDVDIVTEADRASEALLLARLREFFPGHAILAEEGGAHAGETGFRWYIDPLDGTTNFAHSFPMFCVSMGLEKDGELVLGVIYDPLRDELFSATRGGGARLNGAVIHVSRVNRMDEALVATGFPSHKRHKNANIHFYHQICMMTHGVRRAGSAALDLAYVAAGRLDCFWEFNLKPWDVAAGKLIVEEAGGRITDMQNHPHSMAGTSIAATNSLLHDELIHTFEEIFSGKYRAGLPEIG